MPQTASVAIVGAGPAGLALGGCLRKAGLDFIILEKEREVASSWRRHYDRLHLHTIKRFSSLPYLPFPADYPRYVPKDLLIRYFESYATEFDLQPRFGETVQGVRRHGEGWTVESSSLSVEAAHVVIASGHNAEPVLPSLTGAETFHGRIIHSADYRNAKPFEGQSVLVVGMGNTGAEIALDIAEGRGRPTISVRGGVHIVPRELFGIPIQVVGMLATRALPAAANDAVFPRLLDLVLGDLARHGIKRPEQGILRHIASTGRIPVIDVGTVRKIRSNAIRIAPGIAGIVQDGAVFADGSKTAFDSIILATGFRPNYRDFLGETAANGPVSGLHFTGFRNSIAGLLRQISREALQIAAQIKGSVSPVPAESGLR